MQFNIKERLQNYKRILMVVKKPNFSDYSFVVKICALGTVIIGILGLALYIVAILLGL